jgi:hypothetical protein
VRGFLEKHGDVLPLERATRPPALLDRVSEVEHMPQLLAIEVCDVEEVTAFQRFHQSDHDR